MILRITSSSATLAVMSISMAGSSTSSGPSTTTNSSASFFGHPFRCHDLFARIELDELICRIQNHEKTFTVSLDYDKTWHETSSFRILTMFRMNHKMLQFSNSFWFLFGFHLDKCQRKSCYDDMLSHNKDFFYLSCWLTVDKILKIFTLFFTSQELAKISRPSHQPPQSIRYQG